MRNFHLVMRLHHFLTSTILLAIFLFPASALAARRGSASRPSARSINTEARTSGMNEFVETRNQERRERSERRRRSGESTGKLSTRAGLPAGRQGTLRLQTRGINRPSYRSIKRGSNPTPSEPAAP